MSACKQCSRRIVWGRTEFARRWLPLDPDPQPLGMVELRGKDAILAGPSMEPGVLRYVPHEFTCPERTKLIEPRRRSAA